MRILFGFIIGLLLGTVVSSAYAKYESGSGDAKSVVGYGKTTSGTLVAIKVDANGNLQ